jgi:hypothetical protein
MTNLPVPVVAPVAAGQLITGALWNAQVYNGVTFSTNVPIFIGTQSAVQSVANSTSTAVSLDASTVDTYAGHSNSSNNSRYVAQVAGWYEVNGTVSYAANATGARTAWIRVNGNIVPGAFNQTGNAGSSSTSSVAVSALVYLNAGDYVELYTAQYSGAPLSTSNVNSQTSCMFAMWVHA